MVIPTVNTTRYPVRNDSFEWVEKKDSVPVHKYKKYRLPGSHKSLLVRKPKKRTESFTGIRQTWRFRRKLKSIRKPKTQKVLHKCVTRQQWQKRYLRAKVYSVATLGVMDEGKKVFEIEKDCRLCLKVLVVVPVCHLSTIQELLPDFQFIISNPPIDKFWRAAKWPVKALGQLSVFSITEDPFAIDDVSCLARYAVNNVMFAHFVGSHNNASMLFSTDFARYAGEVNIHISSEVKETHFQRELEVELRELNSEYFIVQRREGYLYEDEHRMVFKPSRENNIAPMHPLLETKCKRKIFTLDEVSMYEDECLVFEDFNTQDTSEESSDCGFDINPSPLVEKAFKQFVRRDLSLLSSSSSDDLWDDERNSSDDERKESRKYRKRLCKRQCKTTRRLLADKSLMYVQTGGRDQMIEVPYIKNRLPKKVHNRDGDTPRTVEQKAMVRESATASQQPAAKMADARTLPLQSNSASKRRQMIDERYGPQETNLEEFTAIKFDCAIDIDKSRCRPVTGLPQFALEHEEGNGGLELPIATRLMAAVYLRETHNYVKAQRRKQARSRLSQAIREAATEYNKEDVDYWFRIRRMWHMIDVCLGNEVIYQILKLDRHWVRTAPPVIFGFAKSAIKFLGEMFETDVRQGLQLKPKATLDGKVRKITTYDLGLSYLGLLYSSEDPMDKHRAGDLQDELLVPGTKVPFFSLIYFLVRCAKFNEALEMTKRGFELEKKNKDAVSGGVNHIDYSLSYRPPLESCLFYMQRFFAGNEYRMLPYEEREVKNYHRSLVASKCCNPSKQLLFGLLARSYTEVLNNQLIITAEDQIFTRLFVMNFEDDAELIPVSESPQATRIEDPDILTLQVMQAEDGWRVSGNDYEIFHNLFLTLQFEHAVDYLHTNPWLRVHAAPVALCLDQVGFLTTSYDPEAPLLQDDPDEQYPLLNLPKLFMDHFSMFRDVSPLASLEWIFFSCDINTDSGLDITISALTELLVTCAEEDVINLAEIDKDRITAPFGVMNYFPFNVRSCIQEVCRDLQRRGKNERAMDLFNIVKATQAVFKVYMDRGPERFFEPDEEEQSELTPKIFKQLRYKAMPPAKPDDNATE